MNQKIKTGCRYCKYAKWQLNPRGGIKRQTAGLCEYPVTLPMLPYAMRNINLDRTYIWPDMYQNCPCFKPKN